MRLEGSSGKLVPALLGALIATSAGAGEARRPAGNRVRHLRAFHARGQTFVTWKEVPRKDAIYKVYRAATSFDGREPQGSELVAVVRAQSGEFVYEPCGEGYGHGLMRKAVRDISAGGRPLSRGDGLFVWTTKKEGRYHYCVLGASRGGRQPLSTRGRAGINATAQPVSEAPGKPGAVELATTGRAGWYYLAYGDFARWNRNRADDLWGGTAWSFHVALPLSVKQTEKLPVRVALHGYRAQGVRYERVPVKKRLVYVSAQDWQNSFWWGWAQSIRPAGPAAWPPARSKPQPNAGPVRPYAARRLGRIVNWVAGGPDNLRAQVDAQRVYLYGHSIGGSGALNFVLSGQEGAEKIAGVVATKFPVSWPRGCYWEKALVRVWGARSFSLSAEGLGKGSVYETVTPLALARRAGRERLRFEPPLVEISLGSEDSYAPIGKLADLCLALEAACVPYFAHWGKYGHGGGRLSGSKNRAFDVRLDEPLLAFSGASCNGNPAKADAGYFNSQLEWSSPANDFDPASRDDDFVETATGCSFSVRLVSGTLAEFLPGKKDARAEVNITPRRLQKFKPRPGGSYAWRALDPNTKAPSVPPALAAGKTTVKNGLITITGVPVLKGGLGTRVVITETAATAEEPVTPPQPRPPAKPVAPAATEKPTTPEPPKPKEPDPVKPADPPPPKDPKKPAERDKTAPDKPEKPSAKDDPVDDLLNEGL